MFASTSSQRSGSGHVGFVTDKLALGQVFLWVLWFSLSMPFYRCYILVYFSITDAVSLYQVREL
jgi:hypothetical protein